MPYHLTRLTDSGAYLWDPMFKGIYEKKSYHDPDIEAVLSRAWDYELEKIIIVGSSLRSSRKALKIANNNKKLWSTVGCKPSKCKRLDKEKYVTDLVDLVKTKKKKIVAIGETGLDFRPESLRTCRKSNQLKAFEFHIQLSIFEKKPLMMFYREAFYDFIMILSKNKYFERIKGGVVHSFTGSALESRELVRKGYYIGVSGCSMATKEGVEMVKGLPLNRIIVESSAPRCEIKRPHPAAKYAVTNFFPSKRTKIKKDGMIAGRTEPAHVINVLEAVAGVKNMDAQELADIVRENVNELFFKKPDFLNKFI